MTAEQRPTRLRLAAFAIAGVGLLQIVEILAILGGNPPEGMDPCSVDLFGMRFPPDGDGCYIPIGVPAVIAVITILFAAAFATRPLWLARFAFPAAAVALIVTIPAVLSQFDVVTTVTFEAALLGAAAFLIVVPGRARGSRTRGWWIRAVAACVVLGVLDQMFSGFMFDTKPGPQLSFFIIAAAIAAGGSLGRRLEPAVAAV